MRVAQRQPAGDLDIDGAGPVLDVADQPDHLRIRTARREQAREGEPHRWIERLLAARLLRGLDRREVLVAQRELVEHVADAVAPRVQALDLHEPREGEVAALQLLEELDHLLHVRIVERDRGDGILRREHGRELLDEHLR